MHFRACVHEHPEQDSVETGKLQRLSYVADNLGEMFVIILVTSHTFHFHCS